MVVETSRWPRSSWMVRMSWPRPTQVRREGVAEGVAGHAFRHPRGPRGARDRTLDVRLVVVMAALAAVLSLPSLRSREYPLPPPVARSRRKFAVQRFRQPYSAKPQARSS